MHALNGQRHSPWYFKREHLDKSSSIHLGVRALTVQIRQRELRDVVGREGRWEGRGVGERGIHVCITVIPALFYPDE